MNDKPKYVCCPDCKSRDVKMEDTHVSNVDGADWAGYICRKCGWSGVFWMLEETE